MARDSLAEAEEEMPSLSEEYFSAEYELEFANGKDEYKIARERFDDVEKRYNALLAKDSEARDQVERLEGEVPDLEQAYEDAS